MLASTYNEPWLISMAFGGRFFFLQGYKVRRTQPTLTSHITSARLLHMLGEYWRRHCPHIERVCAASLKAHTCVYSELIWHTVSILGIELRWLRKNNLAFTTRPQAHPYLLVDLSFLKKPQCSNLRYIC